MNKLIIILLLIITCSCKQDDVPYTMYGFLNSEFQESSDMLRVQIAENLTKENLINNKFAIEYDSLTSEYLNYLDKTYSQLLENIETSALSQNEQTKKKYVNEFFFIKDKYNKKENEFIFERDKYRNGVLELIKDKNLAKRVEKTLNTGDIKNREGKNLNISFIYIKV